MSRREVLLGGLAFAQLAGSSSLFAQCGTPNSRAAVVIGVNKAGNLPVLRAAVSGAKLVADWLCGEGFEVKLIVDESGPVTATAIKEAVFGLVERGTLSQLIVYFSGHGVCVGFNEYWLLTKAPTDPNETVTLRDSWDLAHQSGISHVVFISDACRSIPESYNENNLNGMLIFPNTPPPPGFEGRVDRFLATEPGKSSIEAKDAADAYAGIYTSTFLDAFKNPQDGMVKPINGSMVIPNVVLADFLHKEVPLRLGKIDLKHTQIPQTRLECRDNFYIGRALGPVSPVTADVLPKESATVFDVANHESGGALGTIRKFDTSTLKRVAVESGFSDAQTSISEAKSLPSFETGTGFAINGARVRDAMAVGETRAEVLSWRTDPALVRIYPPDERPATVGLMFEDGSGTVVAALPGFIGTLTVEGGRVTSVTYSPSLNGPHRYDSYQQKARLDELHALVGAAAKYGAFRIEGAEEERQRAAERLADQIRVLKGIDPTLGIYAAYAYADANLIEKVRSVQDFMRNDLNGDLFDVALLANALSGKRIENPRDPVPFCPMLTQGWQLLRVKNVSLPEMVSKARQDMRDALWTTFGPHGMELIFSAIQQIGSGNRG
jgi:Caspase domain